MATIDEIAERAARDVRADVRSVIDVDAGLRAIVGGSNRAVGSPPRRTWWVFGWSVAAAAVVLAVFLVVRDDSTGVVVPATTPPDLSTEPTTGSTTVDSTVEPTTGSSTPTSVVAASCDEASLYAAVKALFPDEPLWKPTGVIVDACRGGYAQVVAIADQSTCPTVGVECYENQPIWLQDVGGVWTMLDSGTGISCSPGETDPPIEPACAAFAAVDSNVTLRLAADAPTLSARVVEGGEFDGGVAAMASDGFMVLGRESGNRIRLWSFQEGSAPVDTGSTVAKGAYLWFAPNGDLYVVEHNEGVAFWTITFFTRADGGRLSQQPTAEGPVDGECVFTATPTAFGCANGPRLEIDPPLHFDRVVGNPLLAGTNGTGSVELAGSASKRWGVTLDSDIPINCDDDTCAGLWRPGPNGTALYLPYLETPEGGNHIALFVVGDQSAADGVRLEPMDATLGLVGTQLYGFQYTPAGAQLVAFDLTPYLP